jgi:hypothetical protein
VQHRHRADLPLVGGRALLGRRVDDELNLAVLDQVLDVGPALRELRDARRRDAFLRERVVRPAGGHEVEAGVGEHPRDGDDRLLVGVAHGDEDVPAGRQHGAGGDLALGEGELERVVDAHHLAGAAHFGS